MTYPFQWQYPAEQGAPLYVMDMAEEVTPDEYQVPLSQPQFTTPTLLPRMEQAAPLYVMDMAVEVTSERFTPLSLPTFLPPSQPPRMEQAAPEYVMDVDMPEDVFPDKYHTPFPVPTFELPPLLPPIGVLNPLPHPDEINVANSTPVWDSALSQPIFLPHQHRLRMEPFQVEDTGLDEDIPLDKYDTPLTRMNPWRPFIETHLIPFEMQPEETDQEEITLDEYDAPLSYEFRRLPPMPLPPQETLTPSGDVEEVTLDEWYSPTTHLVMLTRFFLRGPTSASEQDVANDTNTAPWIEMHRMDPEPIVDIPGVTMEFWEPPLQQPFHLKRGSLVRGGLRGPEFYLVLYQNFQDLFEIAPAIRCDPPRRRVPYRTGSSGVNP